MYIIKRALSLVLALLLVFSISLPVSAASDTPTTNLGDSASGTTIEPFGLIDTTPPVLHELTIDKITVTAPGEVVITANVTDDISGATHISVWFRDTVTGQEFLEILYLDNSLGLYKGVISIGVHQLSGTFELKQVWAFDRAENVRKYGVSLDSWHISNGWEQWNTPLSFIVVDSGSPDNTPPTFNSLTLDKSSYTAPADMTVTADTADDISGVQTIALYYEEAITGKKITIYFFGVNEVSPVTETHHLDKFTYPGTYNCKSIWVYDKMDNIQRYIDNPDSWDLANGYLQLPSVPTFTVNNPIMADKTPPVLLGLELDKTTIEAPSSFTAKAQATDDLSGVDNIFFSYKHKTTENIISFHVYGDVNLVKSVSVPVYQYPGEYECEFVIIIDYAGNTKHYNAGVDLPVLPTITIINDGTFDYTSNTSNPNLASEIAALPDGAEIGIDYSGGSVIESDIFEAIKGKDKTIRFISDGFEWVFNGKDIEESKNIDLDIFKSELDNNYGEAAYTIRDIVKDSPAILLSFCENGKLPGLAKIRVKTDYEFMDYLGSDDLHVYYFNNTTKKLEIVKERVRVSTDGFLEFDVTHNSDFIITDWVSKNIDPIDPIDPTPPTVNSSYQSSSRSDNGTSKADVTPITNLERLTKTVETNTATKVKSLFEKHFSNELVVVYTEKVGQISITADLGDLNTKQLFFYNYNPSENKYYLIEKPNYNIAENGHLEFNTAIEGYIVVADRLLQKK